MPLKIPQNQIIESKYTIGKEYMFVSTQNEYQGYYYELNGKLFAGKEFNPNNPEIIKIQSSRFNKLLSNLSTYTYGKLSGVNISSNIVNSLPKSDNPNASSIETKFYCSKINVSPTIIKEISEDNYKTIQNDPIYKTTYVGIYNNKVQSIDDADKQIPGLKTFLG